MLLTHAPPQGAGDADDPPHRGFRALNRLGARLQPALLLHGHVHPYGTETRDYHVGRTVVRNVVGWHLLDIEPGAAASGTLSGHLSAS